MEEDYNIEDFLSDLRKDKKVISDLSHHFAIQNSLSNTNISQLLAIAAWTNDQLLGAYDHEV